MLKNVLSSFQKLSFNPLAKRKFSQMMNNRKLRKAKTRHMTYPCVPIWMKQNQRDQFNYPLRSKEEIMFEQYKYPPAFPINITKEVYASVRQAQSMQVNEADMRGEVVRMEMDIDRMMLTPLQKKRLIFLVGPRFNAKTRKFKLVVQQFPKFEQNAAKACDILKQVYWEAKRAPEVDLVTMKPHEKRRLVQKTIGKNLPDEVRKQKLKEIGEQETKEYEEFLALYRSGNYDKITHLKNKMTEILYSPESIEKRKKTKTFLDIIPKDLYEKHNEDSTDKNKILVEELPTKDDVEKELVKKRVLTKKAYDVFFKKD